MTQKLDPQPTDRVLEIGTGSGYQAAVLSGLVKQVYTIEIIEPLGRTGRQDVQAAGLQEHRIARSATAIRVGPSTRRSTRSSSPARPRKCPRRWSSSCAKGAASSFRWASAISRRCMSMIKQDGKLVVESREPTFFVPMTGKAEIAARRPRRASR